MQNKILKNIATLTTFFGLLAGCASSKEPNKDKAQVEVARQIVASGDYKKAIVFLQPMAKSDPKNEEVLSLLGMAYLGNGNIESAEKSFQTTIKLNSKNYDAALNLGYVLIVGKKYAESRIVLEKILKDGEFAYPEKVHANIGLSFLEQNQCNKANVHLQKSILLDPTMSIAHFNLGKCATKVKNYPSAVAHFQRAVDFCPNCLEPVLELAKAQSFAGKKDMAIDSLERLLKTKLDKQSEAKTLRTLDIIRTKF
jgi:protein O-GlcNAc transferase